MLYLSRNTSRALDKPQRFPNVGIPGHENITGDEKTNELAWKASNDLLIGQDANQLHTN